MDLTSGNGEEIAILLRDQELLSGTGTSTKFAFEITLDSVWKDNLNPDISQTTVLFTDGAPTNGQSPCSEIPEYLEQGIKLLVVTIGTDTTPYDCFKDAGINVLR